MNPILNQMFLSQRNAFNKKYENRKNTVIPPDVELIEDVSYEATNSVHKMDIFRPTDRGDNLPIIINIHGGGLILGNKEFNRLFCTRLCQQGFVVFSIEYQLVPDVTAFHQFSDVIVASAYIKKYGGEYGGDTENIFMVGDSAGAYLAVYTTAMKRNPSLSVAAHNSASGAQIRALALISGMFYTNKFDKIGLFLPNVLYGNHYKMSSFAQYVNPESEGIIKNLPPCYLVTSCGDHLHNYTIDFSKALKSGGVTYQLIDYSKAQGGKQLPHAFSVFYPDLPESRATITQIADFFRSV